MNKITRSQIAKLFQPGDLVIVHYIHGGVVAAGIQFFSGGKASHVLCCLGGMEIVEADIGGVMHTLLDNYLTGKCRLTIKRCRPGLDHREVSGALMYWRSCISQPYDLAMIAHVFAAWPARKIVMPICPPLGRLLLRALGRMSFASHTLSTCAELGARGLRIPRSKFLKGYDAEDITPEVLLRDAAGLETIAVLEAPVLDARGK